MPADVSRIRFDPLRDFAGMVLQQGRLLLDADFNEFVALLDRRLRAETSDLTSFGPDPDHAGVAWVPRQTPDAFLITLSGGALSIGRGRMYVDGLLAENHGMALDGFDALLSERTGTADTPYEDQPYWLTPDPLPEEGTHLAYLDVWQREVTHLEDPGLVEVAVGVDATARWQTAWQVRLLPAEGVDSCDVADGDVEGWSDLIRPSDGRLTTHEVEVPAEEDPCELPPEAGFRGLENQTYRVEIHEGGAPGAATFKWSRENASVGMAVVEMVSPTVLRLASVGRDDVLRVSTGDWVEILDDRYELHGTPGEMRQVTVDDAERTVTFAPALPADLQPADAAAAAARHLRVRRWDSDGLVTVPASDATEEHLELGIAVSFAVAQAGGRFRRGDYWVVAARTADGSFEQLQDAPPRGVHHHYARLAIVTFPDDESDCRRLWPPLPVDGGEGCDCTVCVSPESHSSGALTVQEAIDRVRETGGTVCLAAGVYDIGSGVEVEEARSVRIRGQGPATVLVARGEAVTVTGSGAVTIENLALVSGSAAPAAVRLRRVGLVTLQDLAVLSYGGERGSAAVELSGVGVLVGLRRNVLVARTGVTGGGEESSLVTAGLRIEDNVVLGLDRGIDVGGTAAYLFECRVARNDVLAAREAAIVATGAVAPGGSLEVTGNRIAAPGTGIAVGADALVDANTITRWREQEEGGPGGDGIVVEEGSIAAPPGHVRITGNRVHDRRGTGIALRRAVRSLMVKQNVVSGAAQGIAVERRAEADRVAIENNEVFDVAAGEQEAQLAFGIKVLGATAVVIAGNRVVSVGGSFAEGGAAAGIGVMASEDVRISGNTVDEIGRRDFDGVAGGIVVSGPFERVSVSDNSVRFQREQPGPENGEWWALVIQSAGVGNRRTAAPATAVPTEDGAVVVAAASVLVVGRRGDHASVASNTLSGGGRQPACLVAIGGDVVAEANQCLYAVLENPTAVLLQASSVVASSNRVRGEKATLVIAAQEDRFAAVANLAAGGTHLGGPGGGLPDPWGPLNPVVS